MTSFTQGQEVRESIFPAVFSVDEMMSLQTNPTFAALLTGVPIAHQAGQAQIFVQPRRVLVLAPLEFRVIEACDIHLHILDNESGNRKRQVIHHANHLLDIGLDRRW